MNWKKIYEKVLKLCESNIEDYTIVEQETPSFENKLISNENAKANSLFKFKLNDKLAKEEDYKEFCQYIYAYIGLDINDYIKESFDETIDDDFIMEK